MEEEREVSRWDERIATGGWREGGIDSKMS